MMNLAVFIAAALDEDVREGDHSTLACIPPEAKGSAVLKIKEAGILAGLDVAEQIFKFLEPSCVFTAILQDGDRMVPGNQAFRVEASVHTLLKAERLVLNIMQRMSGIASLTRQYVDRIQGYRSVILDTRKTTPQFRWFEKRAVVLGGGQNHRFGLYDMIMLKDNHIDFCGGLEQAITRANQYVKKHHLDLPIEVEVRNLDEVTRVLKHGGVQRIMLDNFQIEQVKQALELIAGSVETEASGGITLETVADYAATGIDYISVGAIIHHAVSLDLSLKAVKA